MRDISHRSRTTDAQQPTIARRSLERLALRALLLEKAAQHAIVTRALAADLWGIRDNLAVDHRWLIAIGGPAGILYAAALIGHVLQRRWGLWLGAGLAGLDIGGEFLAQGTLFITVNVSFVAAIALLALSVRGLHLSERRA
jgi:hypothetical protein